MTDISREQALAHFGVKGMRWGVRNEDDLSPSLTRRETKAQKFDVKAAKMDAKISDINKEIENLPPGIRAYYKKSALQAKRSDVENTRNRYLKDADAVRNKKLTSTQKKVIVGSIVVAAIAGTTAYSIGKQSGEVNSLMLRGEAFLRSRDSQSFSNPFSITKNKDLLKPNMSPDDVLKNISRAVNPLHDTPGGHMNCRRCTFTHELRRRGYDVRATTSSVGWGQSESGLINAVTKGTRDRFGSKSMSSMIYSGKGITGRLSRDNRINPIKTRNGITKEITDLMDLLPGFQGQPNGARGEIVFNYERFGHSLAYEIFNGKPVLFDSQKGEKYEGKGINDFFAKWGYPSGAEITRLDDVDLDLAFLSRWATKR